MKRTSAVFFCFLFVCVLASASAVQAGGFALYEWSNRGVAMATTGYAIAGDASVIATNPALMTKLEGKQALAGAVLISPQSTVVVDGHKNKTKAKIFTVPHAYYTQQLESNENVWLGIGVFTRFGLGTYYDEGFNGISSLEYVNIESQSVNPNIAFKFNDKFSMAVGLEVLKGEIQIQKRVGPAGFMVSAHTEGYSVGGNIGFHYDITDQWSAGFTWRAPMRMYTTGSAQNDIPGQQGSTGEGQEVHSTLPGSYTLGLGYKPIEDFNIEFDVIHTRWDSVDALTFSGDVLNNKEELHYKNTWRFQLGAEYWAQDWLALRLGYAYDQTPTRAGHASFMLPANDRQLFSTGLGFKWDNWKADLSFMYVTAKGRTGLSIDNPTVPSAVEFKDGKTWITGASIGYEF